MILTDPAAFPKSSLSRVVWRMGSRPESLAQKALAWGWVYNPSFQQYFFAEDRSLGGYAPVVGGIPFLTIPPFEIHAASALSISSKMIRF